MAFFKIRVDDKVYELDKLTLGDARILKRDFGMLNLEYFSATDPDQITGLLALAISKSDGISLADAIKLAEDCDVQSFEQVQDEPAGEEDPTKAGAEDGDKEATAAPSKRSNSGKTQKKRGSQS